MNRMLLICTCALLASAIPQISVAETPFFLEPVGSSPSQPDYLSLALDINGEPHLAYRDQIAGELTYAHRAGGTWLFEIISWPSTIGWNASLVLDSAGNPHIACHESDTGQLVYLVKEESAWSLVTVDGSAIVGGHCHLAIDAQDRPHISYLDDTNDNLKYAFKDGGSWIVETVDATGDVGYFTSIAIDALGQPHISYYDQGNGDLKYAVRLAGSWSLETVDAGSFAGGHTSIALDAQNRPHISYYLGGTVDLKYAVKHSSAWTLETVDATGDQGQYTSIALNADGKPRISYQDTGNHELKYAEKDGAVWGWSHKTVDAVGNTGWITSLALDAEGNPKIAYAEIASHTIMYADAAVHLVSPSGGERWAAGSQQVIRWKGSGTVDIEISADGGVSYAPLLTSVASHAVAVTVPGLETEQAYVRVVRVTPYSSSVSPGAISIAPDLTTPWWLAAVDTATDIGRQNSLALDTYDNPRIAYFDGINLDLKYAARRGGVWAQEIVDGAGSSGNFASLALDPNGNPSIAYAAQGFSQLRYAEKNAGVWSIDVAVSTGFPGGYTSLALDGLKNPHISYQDDVNQDLQYATRVGGVWTVETVDALGNAGLWSSIALDPYDRPGISYQEGNSGSLRYAMNEGGGWDIRTVDTAGDVGSYTSLAFDSHGFPHISYYDLTNDKLKYATWNRDFWTIETVNPAGSGGEYSSIVIDAMGIPHITYAAGRYVMYATKIGGGWVFDPVDHGDFDFVCTSLALDTQGNPRVSYHGHQAYLIYASAAVEMGDPAPGATWPVGARRTVTWDGTGRVDLSLSVDGGNTWDLLATDLIGGEYRLTVPHTPTRYGKLRLERTVPYSVAVSDTFFTIETDIVLLSLKAALLPDGGASIEWQSDPGPEDLAGYKLERASGSSWQTLLGLTSETHYLDPRGGAGTKYRLFGVNGLGDELLLGETTIAPRAPLAAWPLPYSSGALNVSFATRGGWGGGMGETEVVLYNLAGRHVRTLVRGQFEAGHRTATWDGTDDAGHRVHPGIYFLRCRSGGEHVSLKVVVIQ